MQGKIVIKLGGSLLFSKSYEINVKKITEFCNIIIEKKDFDKLVIICGGGLIARKYIDAVREFQENEALCDTYGIDISRLNSRLMIAALKDLAYPQVPCSLEDLSVALLLKKVAVLGGIQPGQSTTSVALQVGEFIKADEILILTDVDGIYDKDPNKFSDAKLIKRANYEDLKRLFIDSDTKNQSAAGEYRIFDAVSLQILKRSDLKLRILSGKDLSSFKNYWSGNEAIKGTIVSNEG